MNNRDRVREREREKVNQVTHRIVRDFSVLGFFSLEDTAVTQLLAAFVAPFEDES